MADALPGVITIDGPSGTGKGTMGYLLAKHLGWHFLDSGILYRALAYLATEQSIFSDNVAALVALSADLKIEFCHTQLPIVVKIAGSVVTQALRSEETAQTASKISAISEVREALKQAQRAYRKPPGLVTDGRDMGTVIFPDAILKIFLTAGPQVRAKRRFSELKERGIDANISEIEAGIRERDARDAARKASPLMPASDAIIIDTTMLDIKAVFQEILSHVASKGLVFPKESL